VERLEDRRCPASYAITDLGTLGGTFSRADAINNSGQVVGEANTTVAGIFHAYLWTPGGTNGVAGNPQMQDLGTVPGLDSSWAKAVNDSGQVAGFAQDANNGSIRDAFYWDGSAMQDLGTLGGTYTQAYGLNNAVAGVHPVQVVGASGTGAVQHAFLWQNGVMTDLNDPNLYPSVAANGWVLGTAQAINDNQQIVGWGPHNGVARAFRWQIGDAAGPTDLGALAGATTSAATAVNRTGQVAGDSGSPFHAFLWTNGAMTPLPVLRGTSGGYYKPFGLNNASQVQVVGQVIDINANVQVRALLWQGNNVVELTKQIPTSAGWSNLNDATGVNDAGLIAGDGTLASGVNHAFLMTPVHGGKSPAATSAISAPVAGTPSRDEVAPRLTEAVVRWQAAGVEWTAPRAERAEPIRPALAPVRLEVFLVPAGAAETDAVPGRSKSQPAGAALGRWEIAVGIEPIFVA
jgi:probable HAF family extracellular repeat protein